MTKSKKPTVYRFCDGALEITILKENEILVSIEKNDKTRDGYTLDPRDPKSLETIFRVFINYGWAVGAKDALEDIVNDPVKLQALILVHKLKSPK